MTAIMVKSGEGAKMIDKSKKYHVFKDLEDGKVELLATFDVQTEAQTWMKTWCEANRYEELVLVWPSEDA